MGPTAFLASVSFGKNQNSVTAAFILTFHNVQIYFRSFRKKKGGGGGEGRTDKVCHCTWKNQIAKFIDARSLSNLHI